MHHNQPLCHRGNAMPTRVEDHITSCLICSTCRQSKDKLTSEEHTSADLQLFFQIHFHVPRGTEPYVAHCPVYILPLLLLTCLKYCSVKASPLALVARIYSFLAWPTVLPDTVSPGKCKP